MRYTILDLDNTICNDEHRIKHIQWHHQDPFKRYHNYHLLAGFDAPGNVQLFRGRDSIIVLTARPIFYRPITEEWLKRNGVNYDVLVMRNDNDHTHSRDLKRKQLNWLPHLYDIALSDIQHAYDDREDVIEMYKEHGVPATRVFIHQTCAYTKQGAAA